MCILNLYANIYQKGFLSNEFLYCQVICPHSTLERCSKEIKIKITLMISDKLRCSISCNCLLWPNYLIQHMVCPRYIEISSRAKSSLQKTF